MQHLVRDDKIEFLWQIPLTLKYKGLLGAKEIENALQKNGNPVLNPVSAVI